MVAMITLLAVFFGMTADVCAAVFSFCPEVKEEYLFISVRYREGMQVKRCGSQWNITGIKTKEGCPLADALRSVGHTLYSDPGPSDFLERLMNELRATGGHGQRFTNSVITAPLSDGIPHIDQGLMWKVRTISTLEGAPPLLNPRPLDDDEGVDANIDDNPWLLEVVTISSNGLIIKGCRQSEDYMQGPSAKRSSRPC